VPWHLLTETDAHAEGQAAACKATRLKSDRINEVGDSEVAAPMRCRIRSETAIANLCLSTRVMPGDGSG
jgi:hypothetical protein